MAPGALYITDRAYVDSERLHVLHAAGAFLVTGDVRNMDARRLYCAPVGRETSVICDQIIAIDTHRGSYRHPDYLRRIRYKESDIRKTWQFPTLHSSLSSLTICSLHKASRHVELCF